MKHLEGKIVYLRPTGNAARGNETKIESATVVSVSRVFVTIHLTHSKYEKKLRMGNRNEITSLDNSGYLVFESEQEALDSIQVERLSNLVADKARYASSVAKYPLETIKQLAVLLGVEDVK
jgi:hypothetical protein